jgi:phosphoribosylglycinamide formyltransferase-1
MRRLGPSFCDAFPHAILNVHPSLLPAFPGVDAQGQAIAHGVTVTGVTVHFVTPELDAGPIVFQAAVPVEAGDSRESLAARILVEEHKVFPEAVGRVLAGGWRIEGRRVIWEHPTLPHAGARETR